MAWAFAQAGRSELTRCSRRPGGERRGPFFYQVRPILGSPIPETDMALRGWLRRSVQCCVSRLITRTLSKVVHSDSWHTL